MSEWKETIDLLTPVTSVIHINPGDDPEELNQFLTYPRQSITGKLLEYILKHLKKDNITIVAEHRPVLYPRQASLDRAKAMLETITTIAR